MKQKIAKEPLTPGSAQEKRFQKVEKTTVDRRFVERGERTEGKNPSLDALEKRLQQLQQKQLTWTVDVDQTEVDALKDEILKLYKEIEQTKLTLQVDVVADTEKLKDADKQFAELSKPKEVSSFDKAVGAPEVPKGDYEGQLEGIEKQMDANDELIAKLKELLQIYQSLGTAGAAGYEATTNQVKILTEEQNNLAKSAQEVANKDKKFKKFLKNIENGADSVSEMGSAFSALGELTDSPELDIAGTIAQAIANVMLGYATASAAAAQTGNPFVWAAFALSGLAIALSTAA